MGYRKKPPGQRIADASFTGVGGRVHFWVEYRLPDDPAAPAYWVFTAQTRESQYVRRIAAAVLELAAFDLVEHAVIDMAARLGVELLLLARSRSGLIDLKRAMEEDRRLAEARRRSKLRRAADRKVDRKVAQ